MSCVHFSSRLWISLIIFAENAIVSQAPLFFFFWFFSAGGVPFKRFAFFGKNSVLRHTRKKKPTGFFPKKWNNAWEKDFFIFLCATARWGGYLLVFPLPRVLEPNLLFSTLLSSKCDALTASEMSWSDVTLTLIFCELFGTFVGPCYFTPPLFLVKVERVAIAAIWTPRRFSPLSSFTFFNPLSLLFSADVHFPHFDKRKERGEIPGTFK